MPQRTVLRNLETIRRARLLTQAELAAHVGCCIRTVRYLEAGRSCRSAAVIARMALTLAVSVSALTAPALKTVTLPDGEAHFEAA